MLTSYVKRNSDGKILHSCSKQDANNQVHKDALDKFINSRDWSFNDYTLGFSSQSEVDQMIADSVTPMEAWEKEMARSDTELLPRYAEDILDGMPNKLSVAQITLDRLQAKKEKRGEKP